MNSITLLSLPHCYYTYNNNYGHSSKWTCSYKQCNNNCKHNYFVQLLKWINVHFISVIKFSLKIIVTVVFQVLPQSVHLVCHLQRGPGVLCYSRQCQALSRAVKCVHSGNVPSRVCKALIHCSVLVAGHSFIRPSNDTSGSLSVRCLNCRMWCLISYQV